MTKLRQLIVVILPVTMLVGCSASSILQSKLGNKYEYSISMVAPQKSHDLIFRDDYLIIQFRFDDPAIRFQIQNLSASGMRIDWPNASLGLYGLQSPVRNVSTFYDSISTPRVGQPVPPLGVIRDAILPRGNIYVEGGGWRVDDLLPTSDGNSRGMENTIMKQVGSSIDLNLPVAFGSESRTYRFTFSIDSVKHVEWDGYHRPSWFPPAPPFEA